MTERTVKVKGERKECMHFTHRETDTDGKSHCQLNGSSFWVLLSPAVCSSSFSDHFDWWSHPSSWLLFSPFSLFLKRVFGVDSERLSSTRLHVNWSNGDDLQLYFSFFFFSHSERLTEESAVVYSEQLSSECESTFTRLPDSSVCPFFLVSSLCLKLTSWLASCPLLLFFSTLEPHTLPVLVLLSPSLHLRSLRRFLPLEPFCSLHVWLLPVAVRKLVEGEDKERVEGVMRARVWVIEMVNSSLMLMFDPTGERTSLLLLLLWPVLFSRQEILVRKKKGKRSVEKWEAGKGKFDQRKELGREEVPK